MKRTAMVVRPRADHALGADEPGVVRDPVDLRMAASRGLRRNGRNDVRRVGRLTRTRLSSVDRAVGRETPCTLISSGMAEGPAPPFDNEAT
jgi:hypothetical protein